MTSGTHKIQGTELPMSSSPTVSLSILLNFCKLKVKAETAQLPPTALLSDNVNDNAAKTTRLFSVFAKVATTKNTVQ